ncbi:MAG: hypothetical protein KGL02_03375 [Acidobacteriota bacterium]|nr:hypothetical protein [Acidobacteriota bacterium]
MGLDDLLKAISLGTSLARRAVELKQHIDSLRSAPPSESVQQQPPAATALDRRIADLELVARNQAARISAVESNLELATALAESLARRLNALFWIAVANAIVTTAALAVALAALLRAR